MPSSHASFGGHATIKASPFVHVKETLGTHLPVLVYRQTASEPELDGLRLGLPFVEALQSLVLARSGLDRRNVGQLKVQDPPDLGSLEFASFRMDHARRSR